MTDFIDPEKIPIRGYVSTEGKLKNLPLVEGNNDPTIKEKYDDAGVRAAALSLGEEIDAYEKQSNLADVKYRSTHPFFAMLKNHWLKFALGGIGLMGSLIAMKCS